MLTAHLDNTSIDLPASFEWDWIKYSQLANFTDIQGEVIPSVSFPDTERNRNVLNHPTRFELYRTGEKVYPNFELRDNGAFIIAGTLVLEKGFSGYIRGVTGNLAATQRDKLITDHALPENVAFENKTTYVPGTDDYCCPKIINPSFFSGLSKMGTYTDVNGNEYEETLFQHFHRNLAYQVNASDTPGVLIKNDNLYFTLSDDYYQLSVVSPSLFLLNTLERLLKLNGFYITNSEITSELEKLIIFNNVDINSGELYAGVPIQDSTSERRSSHFVATYIKREITNFNYADLLPEISLKEFLLGIQNLLNVAVVFNNDNTVSIIDRELRIKETSIDYSKYFIGEWLPGEKKNVSLKFVMEHDSNDGQFSDYYQDLSDRQDDFEADVADLTTLKSIDGATLGELRRVTASQMIYEWSLWVETDSNVVETESSVLGWKFISIDFQPGFVNYEEENEVEEITTCFSTCSNSGTPYIEQAGQSILRKKTEAPFTPRVLFYEGNGVGKNNSSTYSLKFTGDNNLIDKRWKYTANWYATREAVEGYFNFPRNILQNLDMNKKIGTLPGDVVPSRSITKLYHYGIGLTKIEGWKKD